MEKIHFPSLQIQDLIRLDPSSEKDRPVFYIGQILRGKVIETMDARHAWIRMEGRNFYVESRIPLEQGREGTFEVKAVFPQVLLRWLTPQEENLQGMQKWLHAFQLTDLSVGDLPEKLSILLQPGKEAVPLSVRETIERLLNLWHSFAPSASFHFDPRQIAEWFKRSGIFFEHLLGTWIESQTQTQLEKVLEGDVKGMVARLKAQLEELSMPTRTSSPSSSLQGDILKGLDELLRRIDGYQILHTAFRDRADERLFILLPLWVQNQLQFVDLQLSLSASGSNPDDPRAISLLFLLHLLEWGKVSIEVKMVGKRFYARFLFVSEEVASFFRTGMDELQRRLLHLGFHPEIQVATQTPEQMIEHFMGEMKGDGSPLFDVVI